MPQQRWEGVLARRQQVAALNLQGLHQGEIATRLGVSQQQISQDLKRCKEAWQQAALQDTAETMARVLAENALVKREAWGGWARSQEPREVTETAATEGAAPSRTAKLRREGQSGDAKFLDTVLKCLAQESELLGLMPPSRLKLDLDDVTDAELLAMAAGHAPERVLRPPMAEA